jgi:hypothetical protein
MRQKESLQEIAEKERAAFRAIFFEVEVVLVRGPGSALFVFRDPCPQCGFRHVHGAGPADIDDPAAWAGGRARHCPDFNRRGKPLDRAALRDYSLVWRGLEQTREERLP